MTDEMNQDAFAKRVSQPLRAAERVDETFEARVMSAVQAAARAGIGQRRRGWWTRPRTVHFTPIGGLAIAASIAGLLWGGSLLFGPMIDEALRDPKAGGDTVHVLRFALVDPSARSVALVGTFNQWQKRATVMQSGGVPGMWTVEVTLPRGRHEYAFVVTDADGERWVADPTAQPLRDDFGTETSVVAVGKPSS